MNIVLPLYDSVVLICALESAIILLDEPDSYIDDMYRDQQSIIESTVYNTLKVKDEELAKSILYIMKYRRKLTLDHRNVAFKPTQKLIENELDKSYTDLLKEMYKTHDL